jgi:hypothetical protein
MASYLDQLIQEFSMPDIAGQAGITAQPQAAVSGIDQLQALINQQEELRKRQQSALSDYSALAAKRPESRLLQENQTMGQFFKDPSEAQRAFMVNAGLKLAMGDSTRDISSRLAEALGQGVGALQATRASDIKQQQIEAKSQIEQMALEQEGLADRFTQRRAMLGEERAVSAEERALEDQAMQATKQRAAEKKLDRVPSVYLAGQPVFKNYQGETVFIDGTPLSPEQEARVSRPRAEGGSIIFDQETGQMRVAPGANRYRSKADADFGQALRESVNEAEPVLQSLDSMSQLLDEGIKTGRGTGLQRGFGSAVEGVENLLGVDIPQTEGAETQAQFGDLFETYRKRQGIENLRSFGGSDTERELQVSLEIQPSLNYSNAVNRAIIANKKAAVRVLAEKETFYNNWYNKYGSFDAQDESGMASGEAWRKYQRDNFKQEDITGIPSADLKQFNMSADSRLKTANRKRLLSDNETVQKALNAIR